MRRIFRNSDAKQIVTEVKGCQPKNVDYHIDMFNMGFCLFAT